MRLTLYQWLKPAANVTTLEQAAVNKINEIANDRVGS